MKFKLESTCLKCGSRNIWVELSMGQGSGCLYMECRDCGEHDGWHDQGRGVEDIEFAFNVGNGIKKMPWSLERITEVVQRKIEERKVLGLDSESLFITNSIWDDLTIEQPNALGHSHFLGLKIYTLESDDEEIIEVGGST